MSSATPWTSLGETLKPLIGDTTPKTESDKRKERRLLQSYLYLCLVTLKTYTQSFTIIARLRKVLGNPSNPVYHQGYFISAIETQKEELNSVKKMLWTNAREGKVKIATFERKKGLKSSKKIPIYLKFAVFDLKEGLEFWRNSLKDSDVIYKEEEVLEIIKKLQLESDLVFRVERD